MNNTFLDYIPLLILFYVIVYFNFTAELLGCSLQKLLSSNYLLKHLIGIMGMYLFINITKENQPPLKSLIMTLPMYSLFLINSRGYYSTIIINFILLFILYYIDTHRIYNLNNNELSEENNKKYIITEFIIFCIIIFISIIGFIKHIYNVKSNYKIKNWSWKKFILGKHIHC